MSDPRSARRPAPRLGFVDDARGCAVVLMILWHTVDGWIRPALKSGPGFDTLRVFGGTAAPLFLALAGAGAALKASSDRDRGLTATSARLREQVARGLHVMTAGYALRAFMWVVDGAAILHGRNASAFVPILLGLGFTLRGLELLGPGHRRGRAYTALGVLLYGSGILALARIAPREVPHLLRVDVLQAIGLSLTIVALADPGIDRLVRSITTRIGAAFDLPIRFLVTVAIGFALACATESVERRMPGALPPELAALVSKWATPLGQDIARFPLFPWVGYAFVGAGVGLLWHAAAARPIEGMLAVCSASACVASLASTPVAYHVMAVHTSLQKPIFMVHKIGLGIAVAGLVSIVCELARRYPLRELGRTSMLIYWVHLELVYGLSGKPFARFLGYPAWALAFVLLTLLMAWAAHLRCEPPKLLAGLGRRILREPGAPQEIR